MLIIEEDKQRRRKKEKKAKAKSEVLLSEAFPYLAIRVNTQRQESTEFGGFLPLSILPELLNQNHSLSSKDNCLNQSRDFEVYIQRAALQIGTGSQFLSDLNRIGLGFGAYLNEGRRWETCSVLLGPARLSRVLTGAPLHLFLAFPLHQPP